MNLISFILPIILLCEVQGAKILGIFPVAGKSHYHLANSLMRGLAEKGHDVTMISPFKEKNPPPKNGTYRDIVLTNIVKSDDKGLNFFDFENMSFIIYGIFMNILGNSLTESTLSHPNVQKLLKSDEKFDVVIVEQFVNDGLKVLAYHYRAPLVSFVTFGSNAWINPLVANPAPPSYVAEQAINFDHKNFFDRLKNTVIYMFGELNRNLIFFPAQNRIVKKYFPDAPDLDVIIYNISLVLLNSHVSTNKAVPRVPNMVDIGGFHVKPPKKLPTDLQEYLDNAKEGVIYFSMGSNLQSVNMPIEKREAILKTFSKLKQKVLWKWEDDVLPGQPPNVRLGKWLPQQDILAHPNIKAFITHGGLLSLIESVYHGVPILAIPIFGDQKINAAEAVWNGFGLSLSFNEITEEKLTKSLNEILDNTRFRENMQERSKIMHDRRFHPLDDADYWIRYVIRHKGATYLRVAGLDLAWYQYLSLDVAAFIISVT
ncbi:UDPGT and/or Glyco tran 28 C domain containing protein, partial [Asbolus verrucosus]